MTFRYDRRTDRYVGDGRGLGPGFPAFELDEWELGARVALGLDDPEQWWWELDRLRLREAGWTKEELGDDLEADHQGVG